MTTIVDSLIVTLGLDSSGFKKGTDEATRQTKATQDTLKKSGEAMSRSLLDVARNVAVLFVGFESTSGLINFLGKLNQMQASIGRMALNFGMSAHSLDVWDKAVARSGGTVEGAQGAIGGLLADITRLHTTSEPSGLLRFLAAMGVNFQNIGENGRTAIDVFKDLAVAMDRMPRSQAFLLATQYGVSPDVMQLLGRDPAKRAEEFRKAEQESKINDANAKAADELRERWYDIKQQMEAIGIVFLTKITPAIERMLPAVERLAIVVADYISTFQLPGKTKETPAEAEAFNEKIDERNAGIEDKRKIWDRFKSFFAGVLSAGPIGILDNILGASTASLADNIKRWSSDHLTPVPAQYSDTFDEATTKYGLPPGLLPAIAYRESGFNPNVAQGAAGERGMMQIIPTKDYPNPGADPRADIRYAGQYLRRLHDQLGGEWDRAEAAYNDGARNVQNGTVAPSTRNNYVPAAEIFRARYAAAARSGTTIVNNNTTTGDITLNTRATDGKAAAVDFRNEMNKRYGNSVFQADSGIIP